MRYDAIVVGTGQAAVPLAEKLAASGRSVLLAERSRLGGTCVNYGCTPTKTLVASARAAHVARTAERLGIRAGRVEVDFAAVMARKDAMVRQWQEGLERRIARAGARLRLVHGHARFVGRRELELGGERHQAEVVVLNVGTGPLPPPVQGGDAVPWLDNRRALELRAPPEHLLVLGGGCTRWATSPAAPSSRTPPGTTTASSGTCWRGGRPGAARAASSPTPSSRTPRSAAWA
jgi:pyruvate/2-oxoglutarate dehydrogenase complex dihydrolipoamide dehydrogenase (E3) component